MKKFNKDGHYLYKDAQHNNDLDDMLSLMKEGLVQEVTLLSQNIKKKTQRAIAIKEEFNGDDVLARLEKYAKQYDLYAFLLEESHCTIFLKEIEDIGFSKSSLDSLIKRATLKNMMLRLTVIHLRIVYLNKKINVNLPLINN